MKSELLEQQLNSSVSLEERESLIARQSIFCLLTPDAVRHLALLMEEIHLNAQEVIVREGDCFDGFFLIISGQVALTRALQRVQKTQPRHIATLGAGKAIGLTEFGFPCEHGIRNVTVTTSLPTTLLRVDLHDFYHFLIEHGAVYPSLKNMSEKFLLLNFIRHTKIFNYLSMAKFQELSNLFKKISVSSANKGKCDLSLSGEVTVVVPDRSQTYYILATLQESYETLMNARMDTPSPLMKNNAKLLIIKIHYTQDFLAKDVSADLSANTIHSKKISSLSESNTLFMERQCVDGNTLTSLSHIKELKLKGSHATKVVLEKVNGKNNAGSILENGKAEFKELSTSEMYLIMMKLKKLGFGDFDEIVECTQSIPAFKKLVRKIVHYWRGKTHCEES